MHHRHHSFQRHTCRQCGDHNAGWVWRGSWRARAVHDLCPRCFRTELDRARAQLLAERCVAPLPLRRAA